MSNKKATGKILDAPSNEDKSLWIRLAEDAEVDAKKALDRSKQLVKAAKIFRETRQLMSK
jgi:hypothetical protein